MKKFYALFSSLLFFITMAFAQIPSYVPSNGLVGWWPFNGNANDESGNGNNGTSNGASLTVDRFGISNSAYSFNGTSDYISLINAPITGTGDWTITFWYKSTTQAVQHILAFGDENNFRDCIQIFIGSDNKLHFDLEAVSGPKTINTVTDGSWHFGTVIVKAGNGYIYDNSNVSDSINGMNPNITNAVSKFIGKGRLAIGNAASFNGKIDDIGIWNRVLTQQEINSVTNSSTQNCYAIYDGFDNNIGGWAYKEYVIPNGYKIDSVYMGATRAGYPVSSMDYIFRYNPGTNVINLSTSIEPFSYPLINTSMYDTWFNLTSFNYTSKGVVRVFLPVNSGATWNNLCFAISPFLFDTCHVTEYDTITTNITVYDTITTNIAVYDTIKVYEPVSVPTYGLVGWWPFSGNANDLSGNGNNGIVRGASLSTDRFGQPNSAYQFSGKDSNLVSYIIANHNNLPSGNSPRTVSLWLTHNTYPVSGGSGNDGHPILGYGSPLTNSAIEILYGHTNSNSDFIRFSGFNSDFDVPVTYNLQDWYNIVAVYDGTNASIFINNVLIGTSAFPGWNTLLDSIVFGSQTPRSRFHNGKIDDILIYNRAFNPAGVDSLFHANICRQTITVTDTLLINFPLTAFNPVAFQHTIKVYPNPSKDRITIDCGNFFSLAGYTIKITNSLGQTMFTNPINQAQFDIDLTGWTGLGIYFVHIIDPQLNTVEIRKIVLN
ncbi:MAG: T9SS type A sorting domain-containing protein [Bacteroidetes bacterium]|nr:T9SS type A sorting domain-containing protein [Bacteroidota bacterium]